MVSTRGLKFKFCDGEKVLCYEPDPTKAKVLYDSKVLDVIVNKDQRGRKAVEYLIHFQGWNSSWDRCVTEEYVLKDTEENRQLQRDLAEKAQLQLGAYLYRRERKKRSHKYSERSNETGADSKHRARSTGSRTTSVTTGSSEDGSSEQHDDYDTEDVVTEEDMESSSDYVGETSDDEDSGGGSQSGASVRPVIDLDIGVALRRVLEHDHESIVQNNKLVNLPCQASVVNILEAWVHHYTTTQLSHFSEKPSSRNKTNQTIERTVTEINICRETADGIRVYFDFTLHDLLLYRQERQQYCDIVSTLAAAADSNVTIKEEPIEELIIKDENFDDNEYAHLPPFREQDADGDKNSCPIRRRLRSCRSATSEDFKTRIAEDGNKGETSTVTSIASTSSRCSSPRSINLRTQMPCMYSAQASLLLAEASKWRLIPDYMKKLNHRYPSTYYGAIHLVRLFVKLPDLLQQTDIPDKKMKVLLKYLDVFLNFLETHLEWFGDQYYISAENLSPQQSTSS